ncbi:hypothetical protein C8Q75DRAFT_790900 [Abortiporus biennis]|nr:hypothetical protein C8Q75DRAFT_790900 [Abortiporus biennis]
MRHWSFTAFEWIVRDASRLKEYLENTPPPSEASSESQSQDTVEFEVLKESPTLGDGKFKLEISKTTASDTTSETITKPSTLSLYITSVMLEYAHADYEMYSSMFAAIKCQEDRAGERGARADWAWEFWQNDWVFREDSEVWECPLPPLSALLENPRIKATDSFVICVQIHSPVGPFFPQQPSASYVPRDLLDGLEASLDNANTGDVQFICLERKEGLHLEVPSSPSTETQGSIRSSSVSSMSSSSPSTVARKRIIYAHSDILTRRSEYFATMLNSSFLETAPSASGDRKMHTIVVEEADFVTIYWLLKWVYANWTLFREQDDPKAAVDGVGNGWSANSLKNSGQADEWEWKSFHKGHGSDGPDPFNASDTKSTPSVDNSLSNTQTSTGKAKQPAPRSPSTTRAPPSPKASTSTLRPPPSPSRRSSTQSNGTPNLTVPVSPLTSSRTTKPVPIPISPTNSSYPPGAPHFPISPRQQRQRSKPTTIVASDPHPHPTPQPPPASALSMYQVAHRYCMPGLASLALEHMMSTITPQSSFALLLATTMWDEVHALVEDYVVEKWDEVSISQEFEQCCQEVAGGEWGSEGGKTMMALFRRLRSPTSYNRA